MSPLVTRDLRARWPAQPQWALDGVSLTLRAGELTWLHGPLGAGSSTLLLALAGLMPRLTGGERTGEVRSNGDDPATRSPLGGGIGYLGPSPALQLSGIARTVHDEVAIGAVNLGWPRQRILEATAATIARTGIAALAERAPDRLSGGETQRVLLAGLLVTAPGILLLDEPFAALDQVAREAMADLLVALAREGCTVVVACDDADTMQHRADRLIVLCEGRVALDGSPGELLAGDGVPALGAATTGAAELAHRAGWPAPRPLTVPALLERLPPSPPTPVSGEIAVAPGAPLPSPLVLERVTFGYPGRPPVFREASLRLAAGTSTAALGPNGAGKSTLLRLAMALEHPGGGTVRTLDRSTGGLGPEDLAPVAGFLFQQPERQLFATSVRAECALGPKLAGWSASDTDDAVAAVLDTLGLTPLAGQHPWDLPLPLRRLVALATVLVTRPRLLLLDEPTAALDARSRDRVIAAVRTAQADGATILAVTHDATFAHEALDHGLRVGNGTLDTLDALSAHWPATGLRAPAALAVGEHLGLGGAPCRRDTIASILSELPQPGA
jgi:energy-coupling factor transport system ATP-binding protein